MDDINRTNDLGQTANRDSDPTIEGNDRLRTDASTADDRRLADARRADNAGDEIGEAVGGISGVLTGAAIGSLGGPIGTIIGGIAGAVSGWWAGRAISEAASHVTHEDESYYRTHYEGSNARLADRSYEDVRPAYQIGHLAGRNPDYQKRDFNEVESDLRRGWSNDVSARHGSWDQVRDYARHAFERGRGFATGAVAGSATASTLGGASGSSTSTGSASQGGYVQPTAAEAGAALSGASSGASSSTSSSTSTSGAAGGMSASAGYDALGKPRHEGLADRVDDLKDRVDGNPASRPGPDATDRPGYGTSSAAGSAGGSLGATTDRLGNKAQNEWEKAKEGVENLGHRAANAIDDTKDRVDGNPASRPGPDSTDRPSR